MITRRECIVLPPTFLSFHNSAGWACRWDTEKNGCEQSCDLIRGSFDFKYKGLLGPIVPGDLLIVQMHWRIDERFTFAPTAHSPTYKCSTQWPVPTILTCHVAFLAPQLLVVELDQFLLASCFLLRWYAKLSTCSPGLQHNHFSGKLETVQLKTVCLSNWTELKPLRLSRRRQRSKSTIHWEAIFWSRCTS